MIKDVEDATDGNRLSNGKTLIIFDRVGAFCRLRLPATAPPLLREGQSGTGSGRVCIVATHCARLLLVRRCEQVRTRLRVDFPIQIPDRGCLKFLLDRHTMSALPTHRCVTCPMDDESTHALLSLSSPRRALSDITNQQSPRGGKRPGAGRPSSAERNERFVEAATTKHQQQQQRREMVQQHQSLANTRGHSLSKGERRIVVALLLALQAHDGKALTEAINLVASWLGSGDKTIREVWRHFQEHHTVGEPAVYNRGGASEFHPNHNMRLTPDQRETIQSTLYEAQMKGKHCSASQLRKKLRDEHRLTVTPKTVRKWLRRLGYRWGKSKSIGRMTQEARAQRVRTFIQQYAEAREKEKKGTHVLVYTDESYVHTGHHSRFGWFQKGSPEKNEIQRKTGRGIRLILFHALTQDGLLLKAGHPASSNVKEAAFNSELIFQGLNLDEDYHKSVNGDVFMAWVENRLIPAFKVQYPNKKMVLVLDNAPYHHSRPAGWKNPNKMNKMEIAAWLVEEGLKELKVIREEVPRTFGLASLFAARSGKYAPSLDEMRKFMKEYLKQHPEKNRTRLQECFAKHGFELVFTPPYATDRTRLGTRQKLCCTKYYH